MPHLRLEWAVEPVFPAGERAEDRQVAGVERVRARLEHVGQLALVHKDGDLAGSRDQLSPLSGVSRSNDRRAVWAGL